MSSAAVNLKLCFLHTMRPFNDLCRAQLSRQMLPFQEQEMEVPLSSRWPPKKVQMSLSCHGCQACWQACSHNAEPYISLYLQAIEAAMVRLLCFLAAARQSLQEQGNLSLELSLKASSQQQQPPTRMGGHPVVPVPQSAACTRRPQC